VQNTFLLQVHLLRSLKRQQLTSRSFTTLESDQSDELQLDQLAETIHGRDQPDESGSGLAAVIGRKPSVVSQSDEATQTDITAVTDDKLLLSAVQQKTYRTGLYVDSLAPSAKVPLRKDTEVMVVVEGLDSDLVSSPQNFGGGNRKRFRSSVDIISSRAANGRVILTPVIQKPVEVTGGRPMGQGSPEVMGQGSLGQMFDVSRRRYHESVVHQSMLNKVSSLLPVVSSYCQH